MSTVSITDHGKSSGDIQTKVLIHQCAEAGPCSFCRSGDMARTRFSQPCDFCNLEMRSWSRKCIYILDIVLIHQCAKAGPCGFSSSGDVADTRFLPLTPVTLKLAQGHCSSLSSQLLSSSVNVHNRDYVASVVPKIWIEQGFCYLVTSATLKWGQGHQTVLTLYTLF